MTEDLVNHVVKSTQHVVMVDPTELTPVSGGSGCLLIYKDRLFFVSVQHVTDKVGKQTALDKGTGDQSGTNIFPVPALNYVDQFQIEGLELDEPTIKELKPLDICYTEIRGSLEIKQKEKQFGAVLVSADSKRMVYSNLDYEPTQEEGYSFHGRIRGRIEGNVLHQVDKLVLGMKYDTKIGHFERFILQNVITDPLDFKGTSGAPIFSETGEPVAFVAHGFTGQNFLYGFSARELRKYLDIYIDLNPLTGEE